MDERLGHRKSPHCCPFSQITSLPSFSTSAPSSYLYLRLYFSPSLFLYQLVYFRIISEIIQLLFHYAIYVKIRSCFLNIFFSNTLNVGYEWGKATLTLPYPDQYSRRGVGDLCTCGNSGGIPVKQGALLYRLFLAVLSTD